MNNMKSFGYLAEKILRHPQGGVKVLLGYAGHDERDWLELKAACYPKGGVFDGHDNEDDFAWNVAKAVIALANSLGGVVLLGVDDGGKAVGLEASDPRGLLSKGIDAYLRNYLYPKILFPRKGWLLGNGTKFSLANAVALLTRLVTVEKLFFDYQPVLAIFVQPVPDDFGELVVDQYARGGKKQGHTVFVRKLGQLGQVDSLDPDDAMEIALHQDQCKTKMGEVPDLYKSFVHGAGLSSPSPQRDGQIGDYLHRMLNELVHLETGYAPMDARMLAGQARKTARIEKRSDEDWLQTLAGTTPTRDAPAARDASSLLNQHTRVHLAGPAGSGKSTSLKKAASRLARARTDAPDLPGSWPMLLQLSDYDEGGLAALSSDATSILWSDLAPLLKSGEVALLLDGLNECPGELHQHCCEEIASILTEFPDARVMVTGRSDLEGTALQGMFHEYQMNALSPSQSKAFLARYLPASADLDGLMRSINAQPNIRRFARSPVLLRVMAELLKENTKLPQQRYELFGLMFENWFRREQVQNPDACFDRKITVTALAALAFWMKKKARSSLRKDEARNVLLAYFGDEVDAFMAWVSAGVMLAHSARGQRLIFWHALMQDYFCAVYFSHRDEWSSESLTTDNELPAPGSWLYTTAFTFEMLPHPGQALVRAFLQVDPVMTSLMLQDASMLDDDALHAVAQRHGHWVAYAAATLQARPAPSLLEHLLIEAHLPPKYPITRQLTDVVKNELFWTSAEMYRPEHLRNLEQAVLSGEFPWTELQREVLEGKPELAAQQMTALRLLSDNWQAGALTKEEIATLSPSALCALRRKGHLSFDAFSSALKRQLSPLEGDPLQLALVDAVRTEKEETNVLVPYLVGKYKKQLQRLALDDRLSVRVLSILLRNKVFTRSEFRSVPGEIAKVCARASLINIIRLGRIGLIQRSDLSEDDVARLVFDTSVGRRRHQDYMRQCVELGLLRDDEVPEKIYQQFAHNLVRHKGSAPYRQDDLEDPSTRTELTASLYGQKFVVKLKKYLPDKSIGFATHREFDKDIFVRGRIISNSQDGDLRRGDRLEVQVEPRYDKTRERWTFAVRSGRLLD